MTNKDNRSLKVVSPGRVNLLGEHVDYNDGLVLPAAIDRYVTFNATQVNEPIVTLHALDLQSTCAFSLEGLEKKKDIHGESTAGLG